MLFLGVPIALQGQLAFDVASIKESKSLETGGSMRYFLTVACAPKTYLCAR